MMEKMFNPKATTKQASHIKSSVLCLLTVSFIVISFTFSLFNVIVRNFVFLWEFYYLTLFHCLITQ